MARYRRRVGCQDFINLTLSVLLGKVCYYLCYQEKDFVGIELEFDNKLLVYVTLFIYIETICECN